MKTLHSSFRTEALAPQPADRRQRIIRRRPFTAPLAPYVPKRFQRAVPISA
jgi:hypothetical protein